MNSSGQIMYDVVIVGAGISGLVAAKELLKADHRILVIEKSKSVGGRMATRRDEDHRFDHGAQFMRLQKDGLQSIKDQWLKAKIIQPWPIPDKDQTFASELGLTVAAKQLAQGLDILFSEKVIAIKPQTTFGYEIHTETGRVIKSKKMILTCPLPQNLDLLRQSNIQFPETLEKIKYAQAIVGLFKIKDQKSQLSSLNYKENIDEEIFSVVNQQSKKVSQKPAITMTMQPNWSKLHFEMDEAVLCDLLQQKLNQFFKSQSMEIDIESVQLKKWRFSHPLSQFDQPYFRVNKDISLIGDSFAGASIAGAMLSALSFVQAGLSANPKI